MKRSLAAMIACSAGPLWACNLPLAPDENHDGSAASAQVCDPELSVVGRVDGGEVAAAGYVQQAEWFVYALDEWVLDRVGREAMEELGLDPSSEADVARYRYWTAAFDLRLLERENRRPGTIFPVDRELGIYFFEVDANNVQPGDEVDVFDLSSIEPLRKLESRDALGAEIRRLVDEMRDNGKPDVVVAFSPDRSEEELPTSVLINMLAPDTRFATSGSAKLYDVMGLDGSIEPQITHPVRDLYALSVAANVSFGDDSVQVQDECARLSIIDLRK